MRSSPCGVTEYRPRGQEDREESVAESLGSGEITTPMSLNGKSSMKLTAGEYLLGSGASSQDTAENSLGGHACDCGVSY